MLESSLKTLDVPAIGSSDPSLLHQAAQVPLRVVIHNVGGNLLFVGHSVSELAEPGTVGSAFQLLIGRELIVVLAPGQSVLAVAQGGGGLVSVAVSEAMPLQTWGSS